MYVRIDNFFSSVFVIALQIIGFLFYEFVELFVFWKHVHGIEITSYHSFELKFREVDHVHIFCISTLCCGYCRNLLFLTIFPQILCEIDAFITEFKTRSRFLRTINISPTNQCVIACSTFQHTVAMPTLWQCQHCGNANIGHGKLFSRNIF